MPDNESELSLDDVDVNSVIVPPGVTVFLVILAMIGILFLGIFLWYFLSGKANEVSKIKTNIEVQNLVAENSMEQLRDSGVKDFCQFNDSTIRHLEASHLSTGRSPSLFNDCRKVSYEQYLNNISVAVSANNKVMSNGKIKSSNLLSLEGVSAQDNYDMASVKSSSISISSDTGELELSDCICATDQEKYDEKAFPLSINEVHKCAVSLDNINIEDSMSVLVSGSLLSFYSVLDLNSNHVETSFNNNQGFTSNISPVNRLAYDRNSFSASRNATIKKLLFQKEHHYSPSQLQRKTSLVTNKQLTRESSLSVADICDDDDSVSFKSVYSR